MPSERITYEQVQRAKAEMPDLVDVIRQLEDDIRAMQVTGRNVRHDRFTAQAIGLHWDRGN